MSFVLPNPGSAAHLPEAHRRLLNRLSHGQPFTVFDTGDELGDPKIAGIALARLEARSMVRRVGRANVGRGRPCNIYTVTDFGRMATTQAA